MKKLLALVLSVSMVFCAIPAFAFAADGAQTPESPETEQIELSSVLTISEEIAEQEHTGKAVTIADDQLFTVKEGVTLTAGTDYEIAYENNTDVGRASVKITGKGKYKGTAASSFKIVKHFTAADAPVITIPTQNKGAEKMEGVQIEWNGKVLEEAKHYVLKDFDNTEAGTQSVTIEFINGYFYGTYTREYNVVSNDIADAALYMNDLNAKYTYDGTAKTPGITLVAEGNKTLAEGTDYHLTYLNNINAGTATIKITGTGMYAGTVEKTFNIAKANLADTKIVFEQDAYAATGEPILAKFKVYLGDMEIDSKQYQAAYTDNVNIGEATLTLTASAAADPANFTGRQSAKFTIAAKAAADLTVTLEKDTYDYTGTAIEPVVTVKDGDKVLISGTDYTVSYADNINAGTASVIVTGKGVYSGTKTAAFRIKGKPAVIKTDADSYIKYVPTSKSFNLNAQTTSDATGFTYASSNTDVISVDAAGLVTITGTGKAEITIKTVGNKAYDPAEKIVTVTVKPVKPVFSLSSPKKKQVKVLLTKVEGATKYQIEYGRMGKYYIKTAKHIESEFAKTYSYINKRTSGKKYFIRVRSVKEMPDGTVVYGNWTSRKSIVSK